MIVGLGAAARVAYEKLTVFEKSMEDVRNYFEASLRVRLFPSSDKPQEALPMDALRIHFASSPRLPNTSSLAFPKFPDGADVLLEKSKSFIASTGAACHADIIKFVLLIEPSNSQDLSGPPSVGHRGGHRRQDSALQLWKGDH